MRDPDYGVDCKDCAQWTSNWQLHWGCIGNPDNSNRGCPKFIQLPSANTPGDIPMEEN